MKKLGKIFAVSAIVLAIGASSASVFAASIYKTPAEAVAGITGRTVASVTTERVETGKTYGTIASEAGKLDAYKVESLEMKKDLLKAQVAAGTITQAKADEIIKALEDNQAICDGTGTAKIGQSLGAKFGSNGAGRGQGGAGRGQGGGRGMGLQNGTCIAQ